MKILTGIAMLLLLSTAGYAQGIRQPSEKPAPTERKKLNLKYLDQEPVSGLKYFKQPTLTIRDRKKPSTAGLIDKTTINHNQGMPVVAPDSALHFPILAVKPDSTVRYLIQIKRP